MAGTDGKSTFVFDGDSKEFKSAVKDVLKGLKATDTAGKKTARTFEQLQKEFNDTKGLHNIGDAVSDLNDDLLDTAPAAKSFSAGVKGMVSELTPYAAAVSAAALAGFELVSSASAITDEIKLAAGQTGLAVETMTAMRFAAQAGGGSADGMTESLTALAGRLKEARKGSEEARASFSKYGIELEETNGTARTTDAVLRDVLDVMASQSTQSKKTEAAVSLLNESAGKVPAIFEDGAASLDRWTNNADVMAISAAVTEGKLDGYNQSMAELSATTEAAQILLGEKLLPALISVTAGVVKVVGPVADFLGVLTDIGFALNKVNPAYWLMRGGLAAVTAAAYLAETAQAAFTSTLPEEEEALDGATRALEDYADAVEMLPGGVAAAEFRTNVKIFQAEKESREKRREAFKKDAKAEIRLREKRASIAKAAADEAARIAAEEAKALDEFNKAHAEGVQARIDDMRTLAAVETESFHNRLEALAATRDNVQEEIAVRAAAVDEIKALNAIKLESDMKTSTEAFEHWKEVQQERHEKQKELAEMAAEAEAEALEQRQSLLASWRDQAIEAASAVTSMILDSIQEQKQAEADLDKARIDGRIANLQSQETLTEKQAKNLERLEAKRKALMLAEFKRGKEATLVAIGLATLQAMAVAATAAIPPANVPFIAAAAAIGAGQLGLAAATKPPALHDGGKVQAGVGAAPDELDRRLKAGEFVMNTGATAGNEDTLKEMNRTNGSASQRGRQATPDDVRAALVAWLMGELDGDGEIGTRFRPALQSPTGAFR